MIFAVGFASGMITLRLVQRFKGRKPKVSI